MNRDTYVTKNLRNVNFEIRRAVVDEALRRRITLSDVVGETLSARWSLPYELSREQTTGIDFSGTQLNVRISQEMATRIYVISRAQGLTESSCVQQLLAERYEISYHPVKRGGETRTKKVHSG